MNAKERLTEIVREFTATSKDHAISELVDRIESEGLLAPNPCTWTQDHDGNWDTKCGEMFVFIAEGPIENHMKFCCYCGGKLVPKDA